MDTSFWVEILVEEQLGERWAEWFEGLSVETGPDGGTRLVGTLSDQAALYCVLNKIHALNLTLVSVARSPQTADRER